MFDPSVHPKSTLLTFDPTAKPSSIAQNPPLPEMPGKTPHITREHQSAFDDIAKQADKKAAEVELRNRKDPRPIGARSTTTQRARQEGYSYGPEDEPQGPHSNDMRYPTGRHSLATYLNDGNWRIANNAIFTLLGAIVMTFFTAMGKVWIIEQVLVDNIFAATLAHGIFAFLGMYLALSLCGHVVTSFEPFVILSEIFMNHRSTEFGRNHHKGVHWLSNAATLSAVVQAIAALAGSLFAGYMVRAFQFNPSALAGTPIPLAAWQRPFFAEFFASFLMTWCYYVANFEPVFLASNANPAAFQSTVFGILVLFTKPYSGGVVSIVSHFGPSIASQSIVNTTKVDALHIYLPIFLGVVVAFFMWYPTLRFTRQPHLANEPYQMLDEESNTPHSRRHAKHTGTEDSSL